MGYSGGSLVPWFDDTFTKATARKMADDGGTELKRRIVEKTPVDEEGPHPGYLRASWEKIPVTREADLLGFPLYRSAVETTVEYAPYVEHGTGLWGPKHAKYPIRPKRPDGYLHWIGKGGEDVFAKLVMHPGSPGAHMVAEAVAELAHVTDVFLQPTLSIWAHHTENQNRRV